MERSHNELGKIKKGLVKKSKIAVDIVIKIIKTNIAFFLLFYIRPVYSQEQVETIKTVTEIDSDSIQTDPPKRFSFWRNLFKGHIDRSFEQAIDLSIALSPYYNQEASVGIAVMGSGLYRLDRSDSIMPPSNITLSGNVSINGFYGIYLTGNNYFKGNRSRITYEIYFNNKVLDFWGVNYDACADNSAIDYTRRRIKIYTDYSYKLTNNLRIGGIIDFSHDYITKIENPFYLEDQNLSYTISGLGASIQYDSRDFIPNPQKGMYLLIQETIYPQWLGTHEKTLFRTTITADFFQQVWRGGIFAIDIFGRFNSKNTPWPLKEELGGPNRMRGYYTGRYIDNNIISAQIELRQHLFNRFGLAVWGGAGTVFPDFNNFNSKDILPTYGLGIRWEFKHNMNLRIDYGFGKNTHGLIFGVSEAF